QAALTQPSSLSANVGETVRITCSGSSGNYGWHQQKIPGSAPVAVIYDSNKRPLDIPSGSSGSWCNNVGTSTITGVRAKDEALCHCDVQEGSAG
ncbi:LV1 protein, partial [Lanius ludovicianus]|nr:LV1 protein [Lanius ludovicianus]